jgi:hypothetical protein
MNYSFAYGLLAFVAACGLRADNIADNPEPLMYRWYSIGEATITGRDPARLELGTGQALAVFLDKSVFPGDRAISTFEIKSDKLTPVRILLQRHCDAELGSAYFDYTVDATLNFQKVSISLDFDQYFSCIRLTFISAAGPPPNIYVRHVTLDILPYPQKP